MGYYPHPYCLKYYQRWPLSMGYQKQGGQVIAGGFYQVDWLEVLFWDQRSVWVSSYRLSIILSVSVALPLRKLAQNQSISVQPKNLASNFIQYDFWFLFSLNFSKQLANFSKYSFFTKECFLASNNNPFFNAITNFYLSINPSLDWSKYWNSFLKYSRVWDLSFVKFYQGLGLVCEFFDTRDAVTDAFGYFLLWVSFSNLMLGLSVGLEISTLLMNWQNQFLVSSLTVSVSQTSKSLNISSWVIQNTSQNFSLASRKSLASSFFNLPVNSLSVSNTISISYYFYNKLSLSPFLLQMSSSSYRWSFYCFYFIRLAQQCYFMSWICFLVTFFFFSKCSIRYISYFTILSFTYFALGSYSASFFLVFGSSQRALTSFMDVGMMPTAWSCFFLLYKSYKFLRFCFTYCWLCLWKKSYYALRGGLGYFLAGRLILFVGICLRMGFLV